MTSSHTFTAAAPIYTYQRIVEQVEQAIFDGEFPVGSQLPSERELMGQFGVSRPTVREALRVLQSRGLIESRPGTRGGPLVLAPSADHLGRSFRAMLGTASLELAELVQYRIVLEGSASELAAARHTDAEYTQMRQAVERMRHAAQSSEEDFAEADLAFHESVWAASGNQILALSGQAAWEAMHDLIQRDVERVAGDNSLKLDSVRIDSDVFDAISRRDAREAGRIVRHALADRFAAMLTPGERDTLAVLLR